MDPKDISPLFETGALGTCIVLVAWLVRRVFTHTIPRLAADFKEALTNQQTAFLAQLDQQRCDFHEALVDQRKDFREALKGEQEALARRLDHITDDLGVLTRRSLSGREDLRT